MPLSFESLEAIGSELPAEESFVEAPRIREEPEVAPTPRMKIPEVPVPVSTFTMPGDTLAVRNNNPGNLRFAGQRGAIQGEGGFAKFETPAAGFDALKNQVNLDAGRGHTLGSFINKYAPPTENETEIYLRNMEQFTGRSRDEKLSDIDVDSISQAIARQESGAEFGEIAPVSEAFDTAPPGLSFEKLDQVGAPVETVEEVGIPEEPPGVTPADIALGTIETTLGTAAGVALWPIAEITRHGGVIQQKALQNLGLIDPRTPEEIAAAGEEISGNIQSLWGILEPRTVSGRASLGLIGSAIGVLTEGVKRAISPFISPEEHPNLYNLSVTGGEVLAFAAIPKGAKAVKPKLSKAASRVVKLQERIPGLSGEKRVAAEAKFEADVGKLLDKAEKLVSEPKEVAKIRDSVEAFQERLTGPKNRKVREQLQKTIQAGQEVIRGKARERFAEAPKAPPEVPSEVGAPLLTAEQRLAERIGVREEVPPELAPRIVEPEVPVTPVERKPPAPVLGEERFPAFEAAPERFIEPVVEAPPAPLITPETPEVRMRRIRTEQAEATSRRKSLFKNLLEPLKNERGAIEIGPRERTKVSLNDRQQETVRKLGKAAEDAGLAIGDFLKAHGMSKEEIRSLEKLYTQMKIENPSQAGLERVSKVPGDFKPFELTEGSVKANVSPDANPKIVIDSSDARIIFDSPRGRKGLTSYFKPSEFMFDRYPKLKPLLHKSREIEATISRELKIQSEHLKDIESEFPRKKLREEAGAAWHGLSESGLDAMQKMGVEVVESPRYSGLQGRLQPLFKDLFDRVNEARAKIGKRPIPEMPDYLAFFAKEGLFEDIKNLVKGRDFEPQRTNLVLDDLATIQQRIGTPVKDSTAFHHLKRRGLEEGIKLELDPLVIYSRYLNESLRHIHTSPLNAFIKELVSKKLTDPKSGASNRFKDINPSAAAELASWNNKLAGLGNVPLPPTFERLANRGMQNLTVAQLFGNARTAAVQTVALFPTAVKHGYVATARGIADTAVRRKNAPVRKSSVLETSIMDAAVADMANAIAGTPIQKAKVGAVNVAKAPMQWIDYLAREATFRTVWNNLEPLVKKGKMTEREAIRIADSEIIRTQGSGAGAEVSPIQRNVLGKMATLWQTFTINHLNFIAKDVLGIKNPEAKPTQTATRVARYVGGMVIINALFERVGGIQSPMPAPVQTLIRGLEEGDSGAALTLKTLLEVSEAFPFGSSIKFGSSPAGPLVEHAGDIAKAISGSTEYNPDMLEKAINGDEKALIALGEILGKTLGVPATAQAAKAARGLKRGEPLLRSIFGRIGKPTKKVGKRRRRRAKRRRRR